MNLVQILERKLEFAVEGTIQEVLVFDNFECLFSCLFCAVEMGDKECLVIAVLECFVVWEFVSFYVELGGFYAGFVFCVELCLTDGDIGVVVGDSLLLSCCVWVLDFGKGSFRWGNVFILLVRQHSCKC
ncbi:hypothetical protein PVK06_028839 [Gossypium arboreum]|uniref:Transmembrane protein n=1 Tax=Gossypium arboreum TaxID=29729 RepID=A0ABR0P4Z6_GOSAR|nr:hypothetical protein PVK06_028839 [Gossypium arboreum]